MTASDPSADLYAIPPCSITMVDRNSILLIRRDTGATAALDARWQPLLNPLRVFRTLREHAVVIAASSPQLKGQEAQLEQALRTLVPRRLLVSASELIARYRDAASVEPPPVAVCIRTCDRPRALHRLLDSLCANQVAYGSDWAIEVFDDSRDPQSIRENRRLVDEAAARLRLTYVGREAQSELIATLCEAAPEDAPHLHWLLSSDHAEHQGQPTHGVMSNHLFLRHAGARVIMVDDDAVPRGWTVDDPDWHLVFSNTRGMGTAFLTTEEATAALRPYEGDPLALHARVLGCSLSQAAERLAGAEWTAESLVGQPYEWAAAPRPEQARVRQTVNGVLGDTGSAGDHALLFQAPNVIAPIIQDEDAYQRFRQAERCAFTGGPGPTLFNTASFHHATCAGVDLGPYIGPLMPAGRGEDEMLGTLLRFLYPQDYGLSLPIGVEHRPAETRTWRFSPDLQALPPTPPLAMALWMARVPAPGDLPPRERLELLAQTILWNSARGELADTLGNILATEHGDVLGTTLAGARGTLTTITRGCASWREDVAALGQRAAAALQREEAVDPGVKSRVAGQLLRYAQALPAWNRAIAHRAERSAAPG